MVEKSEDVVHLVFEEQFEVRTGIVVKLLADSITFDHFFVLHVPEIGHAAAGPDDDEESR